MDEATRKALTEIADAIRGLDYTADYYARRSRIEAKLRGLAAKCYVCGEYGCALRDNLLHKTYG